MIILSKHYKPNEFAELLNVSVITLQRWDNNGKTIIYTRVSTSNQKDDLKNQVEFLRQYANAKGIIVDEVIEDYGSGLNYNRKNGINLLIIVCKMK